MAVSLGTIYAELGLRMDKFVQGASQAKVKITALEQRMKDMEEASNMLASGVLAVGAAMGAAGAYAITLAAQMEQSEIAFGTLLGSGEKAQEFLADLAGFAAKTPFELRGLKQGSRMLLAFGFQAQDIIPMMTAVGDSVAALGGGEFEIQRVVRALGQMQAKGKVSAQEMMQLAELGIPVWEMLAKEIGVSVPEAMELASQGAIDGMTGVNAILAGMQGRFAGAMDAQSKTVIGMWSTIKDNVNLAAVSMGKTLIEALDISEHMEQAIAMLDELRITMEAFAKVVTERGLRAAVVELFGPGTTTAILTVGGAIIGGLVPSIYAATKALWLKFAALAALKPWLLLGAGAGALFANRMIAQAEATSGGTKSLQDHIGELRRQATSSRNSVTQTDRFRDSLRQTGTQARQTGRDVSDAARLAQERIRDATSRIDRLHDALFRALRRKYEKDRDAAMSAIDQQFAARRRAIEDQLGLLDETARREDFHADRAESQSELTMLRREAEYETDARRRAAIMNRVAEIEKDLAQGQLRFDRDTRRRGLQEQLTALREEEDNAITSAETMWAKRLEDARLNGQAEKMIIDGNQKAILALLQEHGDGWRDIGATFGQRLVEGMGSYPEELRRMVVGALNDVRATADGTIARLREVAVVATQTQAVAPVLATVNPAVRPQAPTRMGDLRRAEASVLPPARVGLGDLRAAEAQLPLQGFFNSLRQGVRDLLGAGRPTVVEAVRTPQQVVTHTGPLVNIQTMNIRREEDIDRISRGLHRHIQAGTRARGGR